VIAALSSLANSLIIRAFSYTQGNISQAVGRTNGYAECPCQRPKFYTCSRSDRRVINGGELGRPKRFDRYWQCHAPCLLPDRFRVRATRAPE
jgi:hypothetical protein